MSTMSVVGLVGAVLAALGIGIWLYFHIRRQKYIATFTDRGWTFVDKPSIVAAHGLNCPPFGLGTGRSVDDQIVGRTSRGRSFQAFEYSSSAYRGSGYVATVRLPRPMPELYVFPRSQPRGAVEGGLVVSETPTHVVVSTDVEFGRRAGTIICSTLGNYPTPPNLSVDGDQLVSLSAPDQAEALAPFLDALDATAAALASDPALQQFSAPAPPPRLGVYGHPGWEYRTRDDALLNLIDHVSSGQNHRAEDAILGDDPVFPFIALTHHWETTRTVSTTDASGNTSTHTQTDHHVEQLFALRPRFTFRPFKFDRGMMGNRVRFEWDDFNQVHTVRCADPRFASDVFHPRQLEYLMRGAIPFEYTARGSIEVSLRDHSPAAIAATIAFLRGFFGRVPRFVWEFLGYEEPPLPLLRGDI